MLLEIGVSADEIKKFNRWDKVNYIKTHTNDERYKREKKRNFCRSRKSFINY